MLISGRLAPRRVALRLTEEIARRSRSACEHNSYMRSRIPSLIQANLSRRTGKCPILRYGELTRQAADGYKTRRGACAHGVRQLPHPLTHALRGPQAAMDSSALMSAKATPGCRGRQGMNGPRSPEG